jgi:hypothetical protein
MSYFYELEKTGTFGAPKILWDNGREFFKTHKTRGVLGKLGYIGFLH